MKKILTILVIALLSPLALAADEPTIAVVNVADLYNKSTFVQKANKDLQEQVKSMEEKLQAKKNKLQSMVNSYEKTSSSKKKSLAQQITTEQSLLTKMTQEYQQKIQELQNAGLQKFTTLVQEAVTKIAKEKHIHTVLNSTSIVYSDNTWIDITKEVETAMQQK